MVLQTLRTRIRRVLPLSSALAAILLFSSCASDTTGINRPGFGNLALQARFPSLAMIPLTLDRVEVIVRSVPDSTRETEVLVSRSRNFSPTSDELRLEVGVPMSTTNQTVEVELRLLSGPTLLFTGVTEVELQQGSRTTSEPIEVDYVGPGNNALALIIEPFDTTVTAGSLTPFRATAIDGQENDVGPFYMRWSVSSTANGASIDAAGRLRAPSQPGTIWVRGNLPNGVDDSVLVTVTGTPGAITIVSGNHQTGEAGTGLELPLVVRVTTSNGTPIEGVTVTWAATVGGGGFEVGTTTTDTNGESENFAFLGPNPGPNAFTATVAGVGSVVFTANETLTGSTIRWVGNTSSAWSEAANWQGGVIPSFLDSVVIPTAEFYPVLDTTPVIGALTLTGSGRVTINNHGLAVIRNLTLLGNSHIVMTNSSDAISVGGNILFEGGDSRPHMTSGGISVIGNVTQRSTNSGQSYSPSGDHVLVMTGQNPVISFETPGLGNGQSAPQELGWVGTGTLTLNSDLVVRGTLSGGFQTSSTISSSGGHSIQAAGLVTAAQLPVIFNNVTLTIQDTTSTSLFLSNITFQNMPTNRPQITVRLPRGSYNFQNLTFSTTPSAPNGFYLSATDTDNTDGSTLVIDVFSSTPSDPGAFVQTSGGAIVQWPGISTAVTDSPR